MGSSDILAVNRNNAVASRNWTAPAVEDVTVYVSGSGTDTDSTKYLNKGSNGTGVVLVADQNIAIKNIQLGGTEKLIGDPIQIAANTRFTRMLKFPEFNAIVISVLTANTEIQLQVY